jgi:hypothetical protein
MENPMNTKMISLVPTNGTQFNAASGQKVIFELPPNLGLVKGRDSYLALDVCNTSGQFNRLALNGTAGVDALLARIDIYSLRDGTHLETLNHYNQWSSITHQYLFEDKTNLQTLNGCGKQVFAQESAAGVKAFVAPSASNVEDTVFSPIVAASGVQAYNFRRYTTPLKAGIFRYWDDEKLCPVLAFGGLRIEITLEDPSVALQLVDTTALNQAGTAADISTAAAIGDGAAAQDNGGTTSVFVLENTTIATSGFAVGNVVAVDGKAGGIGAVVNRATGRTITAMVNAPPHVNVTIDGAGVTAGTDNSIRLSSISKTCSVRPQFRVVSVAPPQSMIQSIGGGLNYEFTTWDYHTSSLLSSATQHQVELNSVATRAVCILSTFTDSSNTKKDLFSSYFSGSDATSLNLNSVQYFLKNRLQPVRSYDPRVKNQRIIAQHEVAKALDSVNYEAKDLGNSDGENLDIYTNTFMVGRQLAKRPYYYDLKDAEGQIRLEFSGTRTNNQQINTFVWSKKIVNVGAGAELAVVL